MSLRAPTAESIGAVMFRAFALLAALGALVLAVLGSWGRINGAGLTCPDWPLCQGALIPALGGGVIPEWSHRLGALVESLLVGAALALAWRERAGIALIRPAVGFVAALFIVQVLLGATTVRLANAPLSAPLHWGTAMLFLAGLIGLAVLALLRPAPGSLRADACSQRRGLFARVEGLIPVRAAGWRGLLEDYYELTKPRIIFLLLITTIAAMVMAARGLPPLHLVFWTLLGGALAAGSGGAFNCIIDRDIDRLMRRTMDRPVAALRISVPNALIYASTLGIASFAMLYVLVNPLAAWLSLTGNLYYVVVYSLWLKRITPLNIVIGGAAGAVPPLVGWAAVTGHLGSPAFALFAVIFLWTPPHFWALALMTNTDYAKAGIPMLPNVKGVAHTKREIVIYSIVLVGVSLAFFPMHVLGPCYGGCALILGAIFLWDAWKMTGDPTKRYARALFKFSLLYLALMCVAMVADRIIL